MLGLKNNLLVSANGFKNIGRVNLFYLYIILFTSIILEVNLETLITIRRLAYIDVLH